MSKPIRLSEHAKLQCEIRGTNEDEVKEAIQCGGREAAKLNRILCRLNFEFESEWEGKHYAVKQVSPVIVEESSEIVVITVYTYYF